ncbi:hypothetical protein FRC03_010512 [Tulasnella sp. 419]|nr:hypothetical protein FRC03_010512 [Tulasnella sp. 419]
MTQDPRSQGHLRRPATAPSSTTLPSTSNTLNAKDRAELVRRTRKLEQMLGVAMHIVDDSSKPKPSPLPLQSSGVMISTSTSVYVDSVDDDDTSDSGHGHSYAQPITPSSAAPVLRTKRSLILTQPRCSIDAPVLRLQPPEVDATSECNDHHGRDRSGSVTTITTISTVDSLDCNDTLSPLSPKSIKSRFRSRRPVSLPPSPSSPMSFDDKIEADKLIHQRQVFTASKLRLTLGENIPVELVMKTGAAGPYDLPPNKKSTHKSLGLFHHCKSSKDVSKHGVKGDPKAPLSSKSALGEQGRHPTAATLNVPIVKRKELNEVLGVPQSEMERLHARRAEKMAQVRPVSLMKAPFFLNNSLVRSTEIRYTTPKSPIPYHELFIIQSQFG